MSTVHWPAGHEPAGAAIHEVNSGRSVATPELVWAWLVRPDLWHTYYANVRDVRHIAGPWPEIGLGSRFSWVTFRAPVITEVTEFEPHERLAWTGSGRGSRGHHAWILLPEEGGTFIHTEETSAVFPRAYSARSSDRRCAVNTGSGSTISPRSPRAERDRRHDRRLWCQTFNPAIHDRVVDRARTLTPRR
jgi:hypothetical protein